MKRHPKLRDLSDDHHTALVIGQRCRKVAPGAASALWSAVQEAMRSQIEPHLEIEDRMLIPALSALGEQAMADRIAADHARLRALARLERAEAETVQAFGELLVDHVRYEERVVFEGVQDRLSQFVLDAIESASRATPRSCPTSLMPAPPER